MRCSPRPTTIPGQAWTNWNKGPGPGDEFDETDEGHDSSESTGRAAAQNLLTVARTLNGRDGTMKPPPASARFSASSTKPRSTPCR